MTIAGGLAKACAAFAMVALAALPARAAERVDVALVLAVDVSRSVDWDEANLQRGGYIAAFSNPMLISAIQEGYWGRIAVAYIEWSSWDDWRVVVPWRVIGDMRTAGDLVQLLRDEPISFGQRTSISTAIDASVSLLRASPFEPDRKVVDISGDGHNNHGRHINDARKDALEAGVTINGLPIINTNPGPGTPPLPDLDAYYKECVIGGPGSFIVVADGFGTFAEAISRKLILEVAGLQPTGREEWVAPAITKVQMARPLPNFAAPRDAPLHYGPSCNVFQGGGQQLPPVLPPR